jgi:hypothetical protein
MQLFPSDMDISGVLELEGIATMAQALIESKVTSYITWTTSISHQKLALSNDTT